VECRVPANLLVVCTANIARSPLAAALLDVHTRVRALDGEVEISSAGTRAREGNAAAPASVAIAAGWGVDLRQHRSQPVTDELLERSDLILTMTEGHRDALAGRGARVWQRCFTLPELHRLLRDIEVAAPPSLSERLAAVAEQAHRRRPVSVRPGAEDIRDPYGRGDEVYRAVAVELVGLVEALAVPLLGPVPPLAQANLPQPPRARRQRRRRRG
jgi:protein-tyrosine phosphatase